MRLKSAVSIIVLGLAITGCNRSINSIAPAGSPQRLPSAPVESVDAGQLPPPVDPNVTTEAPEAPQVETASLSTDNTPPAPSGEPITREAVSGSWNVDSDNPECRMILAFTKWSGGYRAATRRCNSTELSNVSAWDVKGQQVVLMDAGGNTVARLYQSAGSRYDGTTNSGAAISFTRPG
ncbi:MAG: protease inhibitor Inh/omp19 family protein [Salaquimonas sp.]